MTERETEQDALLHERCALLADQNIRLDAETIHASLTPEDKQKYSEEDIQAWLDRHPNYAEGRY
jgi:hypothetical protein